MTVAAYRNRTTGRYPISISEVRSSVTVLFGAEEPPEEWVLDEANVDPVFSSERPIHDTATHNLSEGVPTLVDERWIQTWTLTQVPPPPPPAPIEISADLLFGERMTDEEFDAVDESIRTGETARLYRAWVGAQRFVEGTALWTLLVKHLSLIVSDARRAEILARPVESAFIESMDDTAQAPAN